MDRLLKPERLDTDPNSSSASKEWTHWLKTFQNFMSVLPTEGLNKLCVLTNYVTPKIYESFAECATYDEAIHTLEALFVKPTNEIFARHLLATRCQHAGETLDDYLQALTTKTVTSKVLLPHYTERNLSGTHSSAVYNHH